MAGILIDTNVLVYAYRADAGDPKSQKAKEALAERSLLADGYVSVQNLAELSSVFLTRLKPPAAPVDVRSTIDSILTLFAVVRPSADTVRSALHAVEKHKLSFWDAMVWAVARENALDEVLTEDLQDGRSVEGVRFRNPFK